MHDKERLGDLIIHQKGSAFKSKDYIDSGVPVVRVSDFTDESIDSSTLKYVSREVAERALEFELKCNDLIIATVGSWPSNPASIVGKTVRVPENLNNALLNQNSVRLRVRNNDYHDQVFLFHALKSPRFSEYLVSVAQGSANQASITLKDIFEYQVEWPSKEKRTLIANILDGLREKLFLNRFTNKTLEEMAQAIFKSWFVDFDPVKAKAQVIAQGGSEQDANFAAMQIISGKTRDQLAALKHTHPEQYTQLHTTASLFPSAFMDSELGEIPEGWSTSQLEPLLNRLKVKKRYTKNDITSKGSVKILDQGSLCLLGFHDASPEINATEKDPTFIFGDHTCIFKLSLEPFNVAANVIPLTGNNCDTYWLFYAASRLQSFQEYRRHWMELIAKVTVVPPIKLQQEFRNRICSLHTMIESNDKQSMVLSELRDEILPKLLSGEIDVSQLHLND